MILNIEFFVFIEIANLKQHKSKLIMITISNPWDPLEERISDEFVVGIIRRQIRNILKSYVGWYDPFCELIQNALDAVDTKRKLGNDQYRGKIFITVNLQEKSISVTDNGIGFVEAQFKSFLAPNVSFKQEKDGNRGNKGVGATYLAYGFNFLQIGTKTKDFTYVGDFTDGRLWLEDEKNVVLRPKIQPGTLLDSNFENVETGSTFTLKFIGDNIRPKDLKYNNATTVDQWESILKLKTPLGGIYFGDVYKHPKCELTVIDDNGVKTNKILDNCDYIYPHKVISVCKDLSEIRSVQQKQLNAGKDVSRLPDSFYNLNGLYNRWDISNITSDEFKSVLKEPEIELAIKHDIKIYGFFCYSTDVWDAYSDDILKLRKGARILRGGIQVATNNMPQGELIVIPLTKNIGFQNVTHVVIHFEHADPDLGRKGFQPELIHIAQLLSVRVVNLFLNYKKHLKKETGAPPDIVSNKKRHEWIKEQEEHEKLKPLVIKRSDLFLPLKEASITSEPLNEQDLISLFNQFLAGGVIRGLKIMSASQHKQYDGVYKYFLMKPFENHLYDKEKNPLGIEKMHVKEEYVSSPYILEYKYSFDALVDEIEKGDKIEKQIDLAIAWRMGDKWQSRYEITPLLFDENILHRYFHGCTHIIKNASTGDTVFPAIIVEELIQYINDPVGVQEYQKSRYVDI